MYYTLTIYPRLNDDLAEAIEALRREYDPTFGFTEPHITVLFPVPDTVGEPELVEHVQRVLSHRSPFEIRLGGFRRSRDHWLLLISTEGDEALRQADTLPLHWSVRIEKLHLMKISDEIVEWATGERAAIPEDSQCVEVQEFLLAD
jgi:2'-5' RNA ligase